MAELCKNLRELKSILYGNSESEPVFEACAQLTQEFFKGNTFRLLIRCLPKLSLEVLINILYLEHDTIFGVVLSALCSIIDCQLTWMSPLYNYILRVEKMLHKLLQIYRGNKFNRG